MMDPSSDTDKCQLYTRAAQNIIAKRKQFTARLEDFENVINVDVESENTFQDVCSESLIDIALEETNNLKDKLMTTRAQTRNSRRGKTNNIQDEPVTNEAQTRRGRPKKSPQILSEPLKRAKKTKSRISKKRRPNYNTNVSPNDSDHVIPVVPNRAPSQNDVIILDDDSDFANCSFSPIEFNGCNSTIVKSPSIGKNRSIISLTDVSDDEDEPVVISIEWNNGRLVSRKQFELRKYQKFENIFDQLANIEGLPTNRISLMRDFNNINPADTPDSLNLKYYAGLTGSITASDIDYATLSMSDAVNPNSNEESITVKVKLESQKTFNISIMKHQKMSILYKKCSGQLKCDDSDIKLTFDGDYIDPKEQVSSLDIEDGDIVNVYFKNINLTL